MKILIVSDTHGRHSNLDEVLEREGNIDMFLHLGDIEGEEHYIESIAQWPYHIIAGNNDLFSHLSKDKEIRIGKYKIWMTHGHNYMVNMSTERLRAAAISRDVDIVMFGHTHKPYLDVNSKPMVVNPGSISYPRQEGRKASYMVLDVGTDGVAKFELKYL
jgi:putative phosphoesterase